MNQQKIIQSAKAGNREALIQLLKQIEGSIYTTAFYFMGNEHDAKDVTQEALLKVYTKLDTFQEKATFRTWVQRITTNICIDKFRRNKTDVSIEGLEMVLTDYSNIEEEVVNKEMMEELMEQISLLPEKIKSVMIFRYIHEFSYQEIANTLDIPINTVKSYLFRGRDQIQRKMKIAGQGGVHR